MQGFSLMSPVLCLKSERRERKMRKRKTVLLVGLVLLVSLVFVGRSYAQGNQGDKEEKKETSKIELIPVYEKTFDDTIVDVIFDTATVSIEEAKKMGWKDIAFREEEKRDGRVRIEYPKMVFLSRGRELGWYSPEIRSSYYLKEIRFYNKKGKLLSTLGIGSKGDEWVHISANNKYVLISRIPAEYNPEYSGGILYNNEGKRICEINGPTPIAVSDEGYMVAAYLDWQVPPEPGGSFYIYNPSGKLIKTIKNPDKEKTAPLFAKYSKDGEYAVLVFKATTFPPTVICLIKKTGEIMWKKEFPEFRFSAREEEIDFLSDEGIIGVFDLVRILPSRESWKTFILNVDLQGKLAWKIPLPIRGNMIVKIVGNTKKVLVTSTNGYLWCINMIHGQMLWNHIEKWAPDKRRNWQVPFYVELKIVENNLYIIGKQGRNWQSSTVFIFNENNGSLLKKIDYPGEKITFVKIGEKMGIINMTKCKISIFKMGVSR